MGKNSLSAELPLVAAMLGYKDEKIYPLHTPGHKGGRGMESPLRDALGVSAAMDVSLMSELDDIHEPRGCIKRAQDLAAAAYGSDACFWAVNGTTQAIHAMLLTALAPGERLLLPRNAHRSVAGGLILGGIDAVYLQPEFQEGFGIQMQVAPAAIAEALSRDKSIRAVLLTSPNYYGVAADVGRIAGICHEHGVLILVDEAHGAHLGFSELLPPSAMQCGADACAQSTHKLLGAMTQCSMLHIRTRRLDARRAADVMSMLTTTSPNYLLMASLDAARAQIQSRGRAMAETALRAAGELRALCERYEGLKVLREEDCGGLRLDSTKVTVNFEAWGYSGVEAGEALRQARVAVELVDAGNVLFLTTYADEGDDYEQALQRIDAVLSALEKSKAPHKKEKKLLLPLPEARTALNPRQAFFSSKREVLFEKAAGCIAGEQVSFYPPGIPVLLPGEIITQEIVDYCAAMKSLGLPVSGPADADLRSIRIIDDRFRF